MGGLFAALVGLAGLGYWLTMPGKALRADLIVHKAKMEQLQLTVVERGALESADNREVTCRVKAGANAANLRIKWVIDDGAQVKQGERLMEIEDSALQDQLKAQKIVLDQARAAMIAAEQQYKITASLNESLVRNAEINVKLADLDLKKYLEGDYPRELKGIEGSIQVAQANWQQQNERVAWADRMATRDYFSQSQLNSEKSRLQGFEVDLKNFEEQKRVLEKYTKVRMETQYSNALNEARKALEREKDKAAAEEIKADSDRQTKKSIYEQELEKYDDIEDQIRKCIITAPQDGMVVYYVSEQTRYGSGSQQSIIAQGEPVREGQKLMRIPDLRRMLVNTRVHEAMISRIKGDIWQPTGFVDTFRAAMLFNPQALSSLSGQHSMPEIRDRLRDHEMHKIADGLKASIRVEAFPDRLLSGHVKSVATVAAQQDWNSADVKTYVTMVSIDESLEGLKPGMSAEVTMHVEGTGEPVLAIPMSAVVGGAELGRKRKVYVMEGTEPKEREVVLGLSNEKMVEVKEGLKEDEEVVVNPRAILGDKAKVRMPNEFGRGGDGNGFGGGPGGEGGKGKGRGKGRGKGGFNKDGMPPMDGPGGFQPGGGGFPPGGGGGGFPPGGRPGK